MRVPSNDVTEPSRADAAGARIEATEAATISDTAQRIDLRIITFPLARNEQSVVERSVRSAVRPTRPRDAGGDTRSARFLNHGLQ